MRVYEYRGIDINTNKMVYGQYIKTVDSHIICSSNDIDPYGCEYWYGIECGHYVDHETVGEYTGIKDKNEVKIYVGDIVKIETVKVNEDDYVIGQVVYSEFEGMYITNKGYILGRVNHRTEVIGNIHENPELLEGINNA